MRKLATIQKVQALHDIKEADFIELCQINGWQCITKKGEVKAGELVVYFEIDSFLPDNNYFSFLPKKTVYENKQGYILRTIKLKKALSQGLVLPISHFKNHLSLLKNKEEGDDVTEILGIVKYDLESQIYARSPGMKIGKTKGSFPSQIPKTNQERIQNLPHLFTIYKDIEFEETLKLDGSSMTVYKKSISLPIWKKIINKIYPLFKEIDFGVCSRNLNLKEKKGNAFWDMANSLKLNEKIPLNYVIQGELIGPRIQNNHEKVESNEFYIFHVFDIINQKYIVGEKKHKFLKNNGLDKINHVPIINNSIKIFEECKDIEQLLKRVEGQSINKGTVSEGRVYQSTTNPEISFKCISNKYLLKEKY